MTHNGEGGRVGPTQRASGYGRAANKIFCRLTPIPPIIASMKLITQQQLQSKVVIDFEAGECFDLKGKKLGSPTSNGYLRVTLMRREYRLHRLVWLWVHGEHVPDGMVIDHINGVKTDNRIANLRLVTPCQNIAFYHQTLNIDPEKRNIHKDKQGGYRVEMLFNGKRIRKRASTFERAQQMRDALFEQYPPFTSR